ncbi:SIR2 family protein [Desulfitobacterium sp. AusDCA]|uniref:SIR2 family protein n=1 Tax=Desulfitobacterium sp. AusDCA TaxID=3240383 RepID=UPI003DA724F9
MADIIESKGHDADAVRKNIGSQPLIAASYGTRNLTNEEFAEFIKKECRSGTAKPHKIHHLITKLGPTCYVTTNYDHLLEQALQKYSRKINYKKVLNNQPLDCSSILPVRAKEYIFKLHGDMDAPETIVLNNEQYEAQYSSGSRIYASKALENILLTRTVVFIGYGLKDPDFFQIIAKIKNEFQVPSCPHYALVADFSSVEKDFWEEQYNIRLISFGGKTQEGYDYNKLLSFLEDLGASEMNDQIAKPESKNKLTRRQQDSLERYINSLIHTMENEAESIFPLKLRVEKYSRSTILSTEKIISELPEHSFVLIGGPGAGKSFFLKQYCRQLAFSYRQHLGSTSKRKSEHKIPVYVDLKSYSGRGWISVQIAGQFPDNIPVAQWLEEGRFILFIDSYNEVPEQYRESKTCLYEINRYTYRNVVIVGDRTGDSFDHYFFKYRLLSIEAEYVEDYLLKKGVSLKADKKEAVLTLLEKPLFFQLLNQKKIQVDDSTTPRSLYDTYFEYLNDEFQSKFRKAFDLKETFLPFAYNLIISGSEGFAVNDLITHLGNHAALHEIDFAPMDVINWLIEEQQFLSPLNGKLLSFFHQSITEFLAGNHLALRYINNNEVLFGHLEFTRLDFVLMYATEFLPPDEARQYINTILDRDMILAMRACTYLEKDAEKTVELVLEYVNSHIFDRSFEYWLDFNEEDLPVAIYHEAVLRKLIRDKDIVGGKAATWLIRVFGSSIVDEMLEEMFSNVGCYNYLSAIASALSPYITPQLFQTVMNRIGSISSSLNLDMDDLVSSFSHLADELPLEVIAQYVSNRGGYSTLTEQQKNIIQWIIYEDESQVALDWALFEFRSGEYDFVFGLYSKIHFNSDKYNLSQVDVYVLNTLTFLLSDAAVDNHSKKWGILLLYSAYQHCPAFAKEVRATLKDSEGFVRLAVLYAIGKNRTNTFFSEFSSMLYWKKIPTEIIGSFELVDWAKDSYRTDYIIDILIKKYPIEALSTFLQETLKPSHLYNPSLDTFLELMTYIQKMYTQDDILQELDGIGIFLSNHVHRDILFNFYRITTPRLKRFFNYCVLNRIEGLELSNFTKKEINGLLQELSKIDYDLLCPDSFILSAIATESFVKERLLPLMPAEQSLLQKNLKTVLENVERQLGHRYL